jgi:hypothetical protein
MPGWSKRKRGVVEAAFYQFLNACSIDSKDDGHICLGENLYDGQIKLITEIFDALERDVHHIFVLKSRQLGISTIVRALTVFMLGIHRGLAGALVFDTAPNRENARQELVAMIRDLPESIKFPKVKGTGEGNREGLMLENNSKILFKSAGVKKSKSSGTLGRSIGLAFATLSELCSYDNDEGLEAFEQSLSDVNPDRLYIYESTARGPNKWQDMWEEARRDKAHCCCVFLGWWSKPSQCIGRDDPDFLRYGEQSPTEREVAKIRLVHELYGHEITQEQLAWIRRKMDPTAVYETDSDTTTEYEGSTTRIQEQPWTEDEAFQITGSQFIPADKLTAQYHYSASDRFDRYHFTPGDEFSRMMVHRTNSVKLTEMKVWEEPDPEGVYCLGVDTAFGENEHNDRSSIEVGRCYADGIDQVAEFASPHPTPQQFAWMLAAIMGWYGGSEKAEVRYVLELNGPGQTVFNEIKSLRHQIDNGYQSREIEEKGLKNIFRNVRTFIYTRPDGMAAGQNWHMKTNTNLKVMYMNHLRDYVISGLFRVRSTDLIEEMRTLAQDGDTIEAPSGKKDDRAVSAALMVYYWQKEIRKNLIMRKLTREAEAARRALTMQGALQLFNKNKLEAFFAEKQRARVRQQSEAARLSWRYR